MSELNKDDLEFLDRIGAWTHRGLKTKILKTQEDSKQWKIYLDGGLNNLFEIVERLKKRIEEIKIDIEESEKNLRNVTVGFKEFEYRHISAYSFCSSVKIDLSNDSNPLIITSNSNLTQS